MCRATRPSDSQKAQVFGCHAVASVEVSIATRRFDYVQSHLATPCHPNSQTVRRFESQVVAAAV
eukprot:scaffold215904_cov28-Attheya_sp.AAC.1